MRWPQLEQEDQKGHDRKSGGTPNLGTLRPRRMRRVEVGERVVERRIVVHPINGVDREQSTSNPHRTNGEHQYQEPEHDREEPVEDIHTRPPPVSRASRIMSSMYRLMISAECPVCALMTVRMTPRSRRAKAGMPVGP